MNKFHYNTGIEIVTKVTKTSSEEEKERMLNDGKKSGFDHRGRNGTGSLSCTEICRKWL